jgi:hypothetical protein
MAKPSDHDEDGGDELLLLLLLLLLNTIRCSNA